MNKQSVCVLIGMFLTLGPTLSTHAMASPDPAPEWQRQTVEVRCGVNVLGMALETRRLGPARVAAVTVNGKRAKLAQQTVLNQYMVGLGDAGLRAHGCRNSQSLLIAISGSRLDTKLGEEDDVIKFFEVLFLKPWS